MSKRRHVGRLLGMLFLILAGLLAWGGWYVSQKGFTKKWRRFVQEEFRKRGTEVEFQKLTLDPFQGLVARNLKIYDGPGRQALLARVDHLVLDINYANLLRGKPFLDAVDLREADLALPLDPSQPKGRKLRIRRMSARVLFPPHQLYVSHAHAVVQGVEISLSGRLLNPGAFTPAPDADPAAVARRAEIVDRILDTLEGLDFRGAAPRIDVRFTGDLADTSRVFAEITLAAPIVERGSSHLQDIEAVVTLRDRLLTLRQLEIRDRLGVLTAHGSFNLDKKQASLGMRSTLDVQALAAAFNLSKRLRDVSIVDPPDVSLAVTARLDGEKSLLVVGGVDFQRFSIKGVPFEKLHADFSWDGARWYVRNLHIRDGSGEMSATALQTDTFRGELQSTINPTGLIPFTEGKVAEFLSEWEFPRAPDVSLSFAGASLDPSALQLDGELTFGRTIFRGAAIKGGRLNVHVENGAATYRDFRIEREEGVATGSFTYDFGNKRVILENVRSTINPQEIAVWITKDFTKHVKPYRFHRPPEIIVDGVVYFKGGTETDLTLYINGRSGMDYTFLKKELSFPRISGRLHFTHRRLRIEDLSGILYDGKVSGGADITLIKTDQPYKAEIFAEGVDFARLTKLYFNYDASTGLMGGRFNFSGRGDDAAKLTGQGEVRVENGNIFAIPFLGPLSGILNNIVPGMGIRVAREAAATFNIASGIITTDDFRVEANGFEMLGGGTLNFLKDQMNFDIRINAKGIPGRLLSPVSKLFEYTSDGKLSDPNWHPKNF